MAQETYGYYHISANGSFLVRSGVGVLRRIVINNAGTTWQLTVYDGTSTSGNVIAVVAANATEPLDFDVSVSNGIYVVAANGTPGDATVVFG